MRQYRFSTKQHKQSFLPTFIQFILSLAQISILYKEVSLLSLVLLLPLRKLQHQLIQVSHHLAVLLLQRQR